MNPLILPASTITTAAAGALTSLIVWLVKIFAGIEVPVDIQGAITTIACVAACHFTTDNPSVTKVEKPAPEQNKVEEVDKKGISK